MKYARIDNGRVVEIIEPFYTTEEMRPPRPADLPADATESQHQAYAEALAGHENFVVGEVPIEQRFSAELVATLAAIPEDANVALDDTYANGEFGPSPPPSPAATEAQVLAQRASRMQTATVEIATLQDAVDFGEATAEDEVLLLAWKQYRIAVGKVTQQPGYPAAVNWPEVPQ